MQKQKIAAEVKNLCKEFPAGDSTVKVLRSISAKIPMGKLTMLVGPSGCGKTTFISVLTGILSATSGQVNIMSNVLADMDDRSKVLLRREHIGFIFQQFNLLPALSAAENAAIPLIAAGMDAGEACRRSGEVLGQIGMDGSLNKLPRQLSGGQQQRVAIARALVHEPDIIVCDEPTASLDAKTGESVMQILKGISQHKERAVLIVTHDNRIFHFADEIMEMEDGKIIGVHHAKDFLKNYKH